MAVPNLLGVKKTTKTEKILVPREDGEAGEDGSVSTTTEVTRTVEVEKRPGAVLFVNIKQDDPIARKNIPQLIELAARYSPSKDGVDAENGGLIIVLVPTDQGYYEADTSALLRLKMAAEYGYGLSASHVLTDKLNLLGSAAHPLMRWLESTCRTPAGLGRIELNFEKFLVDGKTGLPVRRYPRKYQPYDIENDIVSLLKGNPVGPAGANYLETWRDAQREADQSEYAFRKGINYFDQDM